MLQSFIVDLAPERSNPGLFPNPAYTAALSRSRILFVPRGYI